MFRSVICIFILNVIIAEAKYYPTEIGVGGGEHLGIGSYGGKFTNVEYGPGQGYPHGLAQSSYIGTGYAHTPNTAYGGGFTSHTPNIAYVGVPKAAGFGPASVGQGYGHGGFGLGYKGAEGLGLGTGYSSRGVGYGSNIGAVGIKSGGIGYGGAVEGLGYGGEVAGVGYDHYPAAVGISKVGGYGYGQGIGYGHQPSGGLIGYGHQPTGGLIGYGHQPTGGLVSSVGYGGLALGGGRIIGGSEVDKNIYNAENRKAVGDHFSTSHGKNGEVLNHGDAGYTSGQVALKDVKGESVHFSDTDGVNNAHHAGKAYHGGEHFDKEGKQGAEQTLNENHKKGHNIKSFKTSHHLDESGKTEEFYDEDHDEGGNFAFDGHAGKFGQNGASSTRGGFNDGKYLAGENRKEGHFGNEYVVDKAHAGHGKFGGNNYAQNEESYGLNKGIGEQGLSGHHESSNYYKKIPTFY